MSAESQHPPSPLESENPITRRVILGGILGSLSIYYLGSDEKQTEWLPTSNLDQIAPIDNQPESLDGESFEALDPAYISVLFDELQRETRDAWSRLKATKQALRRVEVLSDSGGVGTALQIDESGIYLTAKHVVWDSENPNQPTQYFTTVTDPYTGETISAMDYALHPTADIALISAPTGKPRKPTAHIQISFGEIQQNERLVLAGLFPTQNYKSILMTEEGTVDNSFTFPDMKNDNGTIFEKSQAALAVKNLIPRGGSSGGPIINNHGIIVGVESGYYPTGAQERQDYIGARITPLVYAQSIYDK